MSTTIFKGHITFQLLVIYWIQIKDRIKNTHNFFPVIFLELDINVNVCIYKYKQILYIVNILLFWVILMCVLLYGIFPNKIKNCIVYFSLHFKMY